MAWVEKMNRAKEYMAGEGDWRAADDRESVYSASDDDNTLPGDDPGLDDAYLSDDASSIWSFPFGRDADPVQLSPPFRLPRDEDPAKPVYEGWVIHRSADEEDVTHGTRVLGVKTSEAFNRNLGRTNVLFTTHTQEQLAAVHMETLDGYHGSHRSSGGCLPLRRLVRRRTYDDDVDARIRKLPIAIQNEISNLIQDRGRCSSTATRKREFTVAVVREQLHRHFASTEPTPARRHRLRWWKDNTRGHELQYFVVLIGRQTQHEPTGVPAYTRLTNPWRYVDVQQASIERAKKIMEREKAGFFAPPSAHVRHRGFAPPSLRRRAPYPLERERVRERVHVRVRAPSSERSRSRSRSRDPPRYWSRDRSRSPSRDRSESRFSEKSGSSSSERSEYAPYTRPPHYSCGPIMPPPPPPLFTQPPPMPLHLRSGPPPPPHLMHMRYPYPARPPVFAPGMIGSSPPPPVWNNYYPSGPAHALPPPQPGTFFPAGFLPPSTSWPSSPNSYRNSRPASSYGSYGPPPPNPFSALTTPSSLGSFHVPMFGPIPAPPPPPPPRSPSGKGSLPGSRSASPVNAKFPPPPHVEDVVDESLEGGCEDGEDDTLIGLTSAAGDCDDTTIRLRGPDGSNPAAREEAKLLASDKPGTHNDD